MTLGEKLYKLRKSREMSQEELAAKIAVSRQAISKWELDTSLPNTENIIQISMLFGISTDYLLNVEVKRDMDIPAVEANQIILHKTYRIQTISIVLITIGVISIILSVLSTSYLQKQNSEMYGMSHADATNYLFEDPLKYILLFAAILIITGIIIIYKENMQNKD